MELNLFSSFKSLKTIIEEKISGIFSFNSNPEQENVKPTIETESLKSEDLYDTKKVSIPFVTHSDSDDSDEEIFNNYSHIEKSVQSTCSRKASQADPGVKDDPFLETWEKNTLSDSKKTSSSVNKSGTSIKRILPNKTSVVRLNVSLDALSSKLKIQVLQVFDLGKPSTTIEGQKRQSIIELQQALVYQVHCSILPAKKHRFKTKLRQGSDPLFNETFYVHNVTIDEASSMALRFRLYTSQRSSMAVVGHCLFDLSSIDLSVESEYNLTMTEPGENESLDGDDLSYTGSELLSIESSKMEGSEDIPELQLGLSHNSNTGRLTVEIIRGINFSKDKNKDFYVKLSLFSSSGSELSHTKTSVRKSTIAPVFRESFMFQVALFQLTEVTLMISVFAKKSIHRKDIVGWIALGYKSSGEEELHHWNEIKQGNSNQVVRCHILHQNSNAKKLLE